MRYNTSEEMRWEVMKSMLDDFPQLRDRTKLYLLKEENETEKDEIARKDPNVSKLMRKALSEYRRECMRK